MDLNKYLNETAAPETQYSKEEYAAMKKAEREAVWVQVDARMGEVLADAPAFGRPPEGCKSHEVTLIAVRLKPMLQIDF